MAPLTKPCAVLLPTRSRSAKAKCNWRAARPAGASAYGLAARSPCPTHWPDSLQAFRLAPCSLSLSAMPATIPPDSVGLVSPTTLHFDQPLELECGRSLDAFDLVYKTYGRSEERRVGKECRSRWATEHV